MVDSPGALGTLLHANRDAVLAHHERELASRVDVLSALTADTTPRSLSESGMEHRSARLTGLAVDLAMEAAEAASRRVAVAAVLGSDHVTATKRDRFEEETKEHVARIAVAGAELLIVRSTGSRLDLVFSVAAASACELTSWVIVDRTVAGDDELPDVLRTLADVGAEAVLFEVASVDEGLQRLARGREALTDLSLGALLSAAPDALRGFPSPLLPHWVDRVVELTDAGARIVGGGAGTTEDHTAALATRLGVLHPSLPPAV